MTSLALFPLNIVLYPDGPLPLRIFETRYVDMVRSCMREDRGFGVVLIRAGNEVGPADTFEVGTIAKIMDFNQLPDGLLGLSCRGRERFRILTKRVAKDGLNLADVELLPTEPTMPVPPQHARLAELLATVLPQLGEVYTGMEMHLDDASWVSYRLAEILPLPLSEKQALLELSSPLERLDRLTAMASVTRE